MLAVRRVAVGEKGGRARLRVGYKGRLNGAGAEFWWMEDGAARAIPLFFPQEVCKRHARVTPNPS